MGLFEELKGRVFCPACMRKTKHIMQVKVFNGSGMYDMRSPPWHLFGKYRGYETYGTHKIETYSKWYNKHKQGWELWIQCYGHCSECNTTWSGNLIYTRKGKSKPPYGEWKLRSVMVADIWADSLVGAKMRERRRAKDYENILTTGDLDYLHDLSKIEWKKKKSESGHKYFVDDRKHRIKE